MVVNYQSIFQHCAAAFLLFWGGGLIAQETLQVVTQNYQESIPFGLGTEVSIEGEKADVYLSSWDRNQVAVYLDLSSAHQDRRVAEQDLERMQHTMIQEGSKIIVRNYISKPEGGERPESMLKAKYTIILPANCPVNLSNFFGSADVRDLQNAVVINSEFCQLDLLNLRGQISISTRFGDINGRQIAGNVQIFSNRSNINLSEIQGVVNNKSRYGRIELDAQPENLDLAIDAVRTDIVFNEPPVGYYSFLLRTQNGEIITPKEMNFQVRQLSADTQEALYNPGTTESEVKIHTTFGNIVIGPPLSN